MGYQALLLNNKIPDIFLKVLGYRIENKNEKCTHFRKDKFGKDEYNYAIRYEIHIFRDKVFKQSEICVTPYYSRINMYDWFNGTEALYYLKKLENKLIKYTKIKEDKQ